MPNPEVPTNDPDFGLDPVVTGETFDPAAAGVPAETYIHITTSGGGNQYVPTSEPLTVRDLILRSGLAIQGAYDVYMDQNIVQQDTLVPLGATVTLLGNVKGA